MKYRTILGMTRLESRDNPDGGMGEMPGTTPPPPGGGEPPAFTDPNGGNGINPGSGPIGGGGTYGAPPPP